MLCVTFAFNTIGDRDIFVEVKAEKALREDGIVYVSFKYGTYQGIRNGRYYTDITEESFEKIVSNLQELKVVEMFHSSDVLTSRKQLWFNVFLKKVTDRN